MQTKQQYQIDGEDKISKYFEIKTIHNTPPNLSCKHISKQLGMKCREIKHIIFNSDKFDKVPSYIFGSYKSKENIHVYTLK